MPKKNKDRQPRLKRFRDFRTWSNYDEHKKFLRNFINTFKGMFVPDESSFSESFDTATRRYNLDDKVLRERARLFFSVSIIMLIISLCGLGAFVYLLLTGQFRPAMISVFIIMASAGLSFRYHFWYFQIKHRKLGCSFNEWLKHGLLGKNS